MGSKTFDGVWFISFSHDHLPPHVHGRYAGTTVIIDLLPDGRAIKSNRADVVTPDNAKRNDVRKILRTAADYAEELHELWEKTHGSKN